MKPVEPCALGSTFVAFPDATRAVYGEAGLSDVRGRVSAESLKLLEPGAIFARSQVPERLCVEWIEAVFAGPAGSVQERLAPWIAALHNESIGRIQRLRLGNSSVTQFAADITRLWSDRHTHGHFTGSVNGTRASFTLERFPLLRSPIAYFAYIEQTRLMVENIVGAPVRLAQHSVGEDRVDFVVEWN